MMLPLDVTRNVLFNYLDERDMLVLRLVCKYFHKCFNEPFFGKPLDGFLKTPKLHCFNIEVLSFSGKKPGYRDTLVKAGLCELRSPKNINFDVVQKWETTSSNFMKHKTFPADVVRSTKICFVCQKNCLSLTFSQQKFDDDPQSIRSWKKGKENIVYSHKVRITICGCYFKEFCRRK